jgi:peptidoglycan hydrolase CwlO-like protein
MNFWEKVKADLQKGLKEGIEAVREGTAVVRRKAGELTKEAKKQYSIFELKMKAEKEISDLGGRVYDLSSKVKNPILDSRVKAIISRIKKLEARIAKLEEKKKAPARGKAKKGTSR